MMRRRQTRFRRSRLQVEGRWARRFALIMLLAALAGGLPAEALAHIPTNSPYEEGVGEKEWATVSNTLVVVGQALGFAFLAAVLHAQRKRPLWIDVGAALGIQIVLSLLLFVPTMMLISLGTYETHISYAGYEILLALRREMVASVLWLSAITLTLGWGLSALALLVFRGLRRRWLIGLLHVLVFHPLAFPVGALIGLMYVFYLWQPPGQRAG